MGTIDCRGAQLAWREGGAGGIPLILLHGLGGSRVSWEPQLNTLGTERRVVAWDLPGYGESSPPKGPYTFDTLAGAVIDLADEIGAERFHLAGISFGGMVAQYCAVAHPTRLVSLTLLASSPKFGLDGTRPDEWRAARLAPLDAGLEPSEFADRVLNALAGPHITAEALHGQRVAMGRITGEALRRTIDCLITHDSRMLLASITTPTLCLVGDLDTETPVAYSEAIVAAVRGARLEVITGAGHLLNVEAPEAVNDALIRHLHTTEEHQ